MASAYMFSHYWPGDGGGSGPVSTLCSGYPFWFDGSTMGCMIVMPRITRKWRKALVRLRMRFWRMTPRRVQAVILAFELAFSLDFSKAMEAVDSVAVDPSVKNMRKWNAP